MELTYKSSKQENEVTQKYSDRRVIVTPPQQKGKQALLRVDLLDSYREFFGLKEIPFTISPNPKFFYFSRSHAEALNHIRYGIYEGLGFTMITGEPGTGKTILSRYFLSKAGDDLLITKISDPRFSQKELLLALLENLGMSGITQQDLSQRKLTQRLCDLLLSSYQKSKKVVLFLDEAQGMDSESLEGIRLLSNLETENHKLIQIVLLGQRELEEKLSEENLRQFDQRILVRYNLFPLELDEIQPYVEHQLKIAKAPSVEFSVQAINKIYEITRGLPRMINVLCERAMMSSFIENKKTIDVKNVLEGWDSLNGIKILEKTRL